MIKYVQALTVILLAMSSGCGGNPSASSANSGSLRLSVTWPKTRAIPANAHSIRFVVRLLQPASLEILADAVVPRSINEPTATKLITNLPSVNVRVTATAYESVIGTGTALAEGSQDVVISASATTPVNITLNGVTSRIELGNVTDGEVQAPCGHFSIFAEWADGTDGAPAVTWTVSSGEFYVEAPDQMRFLIPYSGPATVTATLVSDPTQTASARIHVDLLSGIWSNGWRLSYPIEGTERHEFQGGELIHSGNTFSGWYPSGSGAEVVTVSGTVSNDTIQGTTTFMGNSTPFTASRMCPTWP
jgi:hypothetical protein